MKKYSDKPPQWLHFLLRRRLNEDALEETLGDLHELYSRWRSESGVFIAKLRYLLQILFYLRPLPDSLKKKPVPDHFKSKTTINPAMFKSSLKIAWRQLLRSKGYAAINIGGLAVGMAIVLMIGIWVWDELSFDRYHKKHSRLAQAWQMVNFDGNNSFYNSVPVPLAAELRSKYADIEASSVTTNVKEFMVGYNDKKLMQTGIFAEASFPDMFSFEMKEGDIHSLTDIQSVLVSESTAKAFFGHEPAIGKTIRINDKTDVKVTGIYKDLPSNSTFSEVGFVGAWPLYVQLDSYAKTAEQEWDENSFQVFALLKEGSSSAQLSGKIREIRMHMENPPPYKPAFFLHPMNKWHLYSDFTGWAESSGMIKLVRLFAIAGIFILLLACINFMNLSTARSEKRAKEVGIRKTLGSKKIQLLYQFFSESVLIAFLSLLLCLLLAQLALPFFNNVTGKNMHLPWDNWIFWLAMILFTLVTGLLAGSYPALFLSSFRPVKVLKGTYRTGTGNVFSRKILVVFQFTVSVALIIGTLIMGMQIDHVKDRPTGYHQERLLEITMHSSKLRKSYDALRADFLKTGMVYDMAESVGSITSDFGGSTAISWKGKTPGTSPLIMASQVTHDFGNTVGWNIMTGRDFSRQYVADSTSVILNEEAAKLMGFKDPVNGLINISGKEFRVIGVVSNIIKGDPFRPVPPSLFTLNYKSATQVILRIKDDASTGKALAAIEKIFHQYSLAEPFDFKFVDDKYATKFTTEVRIGKLAGFFAAFAIFISLLGLFGLASFMAARRTKEIGIRKVLGANILQVWTLLSREFIILSGIAFIIASPIAYYFMNNWLANYQYRISIPVWIFIAVAGVTVFFTLLTVSLQAIRAAMMNPVRSMRNE
ncbi:MAG: ABC transporter permease [Chitinophagaceae bacterium]